MSCRLLELVLTESRWMVGLWVAELELEWLNRRFLLLKTELSA